MDSRRATRLASAIVVGTGLLWGLYWLPVRALAAAGLPGAAGTLAITVVAAVLLAPLALRRVGDLRRADRVALAAVALGGAAFALYSVSLVYGRVAIIILLYFLTPVWSTLIARFVLGWPTAPMRLAAIALGLAGLAVMLGADGGLPQPRGTGEWMSLAAGMLWSVATTGLRIRPAIAPAPAAFVFALGAAIAAVAAVLLLPRETLPEVETGRVLALAGVTGALVVGAGLLEVWPVRRPRPARRS